MLLLVVIYLAIIALVVWVIAKKGVSFGGLIGALILHKALILGAFMVIMMMSQELYYRTDEVNMIKACVSPLAAAMAEPGAKVPPPGWIPEDMQWARVRGDTPVGYRPIPAVNPKLAGRALSENPRKDVILLAPSQDGTWAKLSSTSTAKVPVIFENLEFGYVSITPTGAIRSGDYSEPIPIAAIKVPPYFRRAATQYLCVCASLVLVAGVWASVAKSEKGRWNAIVLSAAALVPFIVSALLFADSLKRWAAAG